MSNKETGGVSRAHKALEAVKAKAKAVKDKAEDKGTINTPRTRNIYDEAQEALEALKAGKISSKEARARARLLHEQSTHVKLELDHARHTQRLVKGSPELPGFVRVPPKLTPE